MLKTFTDVLDIYNGKNQRKVENPNGLYPIYGSGGIMGYADDFICPANTVLIGRKGSINNPIYVESPLWNVDTAFGLIAKDNILLPKYLYYFCVHFDFEKLNTTVTIPSLTKANLLKIQIPVPNITKQQIIADTLDKLQSIITHRKQQLEKLDKLVKARFVEMFGEPNLNPMGWEESHLSEKLDVLGGYAFKSDEFDEETGIPVLRIGNINAGFFRPVNMVYWREDENLEKYAMYPGDLVMSLTGTVGKDDYGNVCILGNDYDKYYLNQRNAKLEIKEGLDKLYLSEILKFDTIKKRLTGISRGVRQANISNRDILNLYIPIPPLDLQNQFATFVEQTDKSKFLNENVTRLLRRVKLYDQF
ncbi:MAG: restriction endonuclease subunit S [Oscillospiraceae bacterium]|nr:restriction endonuclease subunit S [Oscillospiraceae bacterium]